MSMQEQAVQMINDLSDENVKYLIDFMQRFMMPKSDREREIPIVQTPGEGDFMQEMEDMRLKAKAYFPSDFNSDEIWEEAMDWKYGSAN